MARDAESYCCACAYNGKSFNVLGPQDPHAPSMRSLPTRRDLVFGIAFVISFFLFLQFVFGPSQGDESSSTGYDWNRKFGSTRSSGADSGWRSSGSIESGEKPNVKPEQLAHSLENSSDARKPALVWGTGNVPTTEIKMHVPGWTVFERLYVFNGTVFIVTEEPKKIPDRMLLTSSGHSIHNPPDEVARRTPTDKDMQIISPETAATLFGSYASKLDGASFLINDHSQFINHYYHWSAEVLFGLWKAYTSLDPDITAEGYTKLPAPRRILMSHVPYASWRDYASMNQWVTRGSFPSISLEFQEDWEDRASMTHPFVIERAVFADRAAAMHSPNFVLTQRYNAELFKTSGSPFWWRTIRNNLVEFAGSDPHASDAKVITYVSRQGWGRRMLLPEDHERLITALEALRDQYGYEVNIVSLDKLTRQEQFQLAARTTIMMGVHGNGLTSLLWMNPTRRATVMEFFYPGGFAYDYEWITRALGMKHYGFWDREYFTSPDLPQPDYPAGFQGNEIPLDGDVVAQLCHERLSLPEDD